MCISISSPFSSFSTILSTRHSRHSIKTLHLQNVLISFNNRIEFDDMKKRDQEDVNEKLKNNLLDIECNATAKHMSLPNGE